MVCDLFPLFFFIKTLVCDLVNTPCLITSENQTQSKFLLGEPNFLYFIVPEENVCLWSLRCSSYLWINWAPIKDIRKYSMRCSTSGRGLWRYTAPSGISRVWSPRACKCASAQVVMRRARWMRHPLCDTVTRPVWHERWPQDDTLVCRQTCWSLQLSGFVTQGDVAWDVCDSGWAPFGNVIRRNWTWSLFFSSFGPLCAR